MAKKQSGLAKRIAEILREAKIQSSVASCIVKPFKEGKFEMGLVTLKHAGIGLGVKADIIAAVKIVVEHKLKTAQRVQAKRKYRATTRTRSGVRSVEDWQLLKTQTAKFRLSRAS